MLLNYSMFLCTMLTSALTTTIVGVLKVGSACHSAPLGIYQRVLLARSCLGCRDNVEVFVQGAVATVLGFFLLGGVKFHTLNVTGIVINMIGGTW